MLQNHWHKLLYWNFSSTSDSGDVADEDNVTKSDSGDVANEDNVTKTSTNLLLSKRIHSQKY